MKEIKTESYIKFAGKKEKGKRDGTGPFEGSAQKSVSDKGIRKEKGDKCPEEDEKTAGYNQRKKRDGTGPFRDSYIRQKQKNKNKDTVKGRRKQQGEECPYEDI